MVKKNYKYNEMQIFLLTLLAGHYLFFISYNFIKRNCFSKFMSVFVFLAYSGNSKIKKAIQPEPLLLL
ncbi:hypothetical protein D1818_20345 [Aquimarina sp. BL5]|nr:hypothetical protein D1818_20345 [Aquimarina sp. BL5]